MRVIHERPPMYGDMISVAGAKKVLIEAGAWA